MVHWPRSINHPEGQEPVADIRRRLLIGAICAALASATAGAVAIADASGTKPLPPANSGLSAAQQQKQQQAPAPNETGSPVTKPLPPANRGLSAARQQKQQQAPTPSGQRDDKAENRSRLSGHGHGRHGHPISRRAR
jgi:hypothetical protein